MVSFTSLIKLFCPTKATSAVIEKPGLAPAFSRSPVFRAQPRSLGSIQHCAGYFKKQLTSGERAELADLIHDDRNGLVPLVVPLTLIRHFARLYDIEYLNGQYFLDPHPRELMLRNHV